MARLARWSMEGTNEEWPDAAAAPAASSSPSHSTFIVRGHDATETPDIRRSRSRDVGTGCLGPAWPRRTRTDGRTQPRMPAGRGLAQRYAEGAGQDALGRVRERAQAADGQPPRDHGSRA